MLVTDDTTDIEHFTVRELFELDPEPHVGRCVATYLVFRKASETELKVTYRFGGVDHLFDRELTIGKAGYVVAVSDGRMDPPAVRVAGMVISRHRKDGTWMATGSHQA